MQPMGNEKPGLPNFPGRPTSSPFPTVPQATSPFILPGRPTSSPFPTVPQVTSPFASSGPEVGYRGSPPAKVNGPSMPPPQLPYASNIGSHQRFPTPQFPSPVQTMPSLPGQPFVGQSMLPPPVLTSAGQQPLPPPVSYRPQSQIPSVPMGPPPQSLNFMPSNGNVPYRQADPLTQVPPPLPYLAQQGGNLPAPPLAASVGFNTREQMQHPTGGPPVGSVQGLVEDFSSISLGSVPGSIDPGVDPKALPRPLDGDVEPKSFAEMYPLNCHPKFFRLTTSAIPSSKSLITRWHLPLGAVVHPLAESSDVDEVPIVNLGPCGVIRCRRCRTYVNPYVSFTDLGRKWRCNICDLHNDVPSEYFAQLDANGRRVDANQRPELIKGSVEFVAPTEYMVRPPMPPLYFFLIDVSVTAVRSGMLEIVAKTIKSCLDELPGFPRTQIGFLTFDSTLHFYNLKSSLTQPQMMVVSDLDDIFVPLPDDLLVNLSESRTVVDVFLDCLPSMFQNNVNVESAFGPALKAAYMVMSQLGGKLLIFQSTLPSLGIGRLRLRGDDQRIYGTDKESTLRLPDDPFYKQMAADFSKFQISVNVYAFSHNYTDIASLGTLAKYTGGQVYYYPRFEGAIHGEKLRYELARDLTRETAWEAVMRIRCGKGVRFSAYHGNFMLRSIDLLALPAVDCDKAFGMQLCLEDTLITTQTVYFQVALLYTSSSGERRIRVHTVAAPVVTDLGEMYRQADTGSTINLLSRLAIEKALSEKLEGVRGFVQSKIVKSLREYRILNSHHRLVGRLIFPESLKYLFLYGLALCKSLPLRGGHVEAQLDERCAAGYTMMTLSVRRLLKFLYPTLIRLDEYLTKAPANIDDLGESFKRLPLAIQYLNSRSLYIYDDGFRIIIWLGRELSSEITSNLLGAELSGFHDLSKVSISERENEVSRKLMAVLKKFKESDPSYYQLCYLVRQGEQPRESSLLLGNLIEDQMGGTSSYVDWIMQINRQVQQNA